MASIFTMEHSGSSNPGMEETTRRSAPSVLNSIEDPSETAEPVHWYQQKALVFEGGGCRGFASLLMLKDLMDKIRELETSESSSSRTGHTPTPGDPRGRQPEVWSSFLPSIFPCPRDREKRRAKHAQKEMISTEPTIPQTSTGLSNPMTNRDDFETILRKYDDCSDLFLPCHYFDIIAGTSTGGLSALMLGRLRMTVEECIELYPGMAKRIFRKRHRVCVPFLMTKYDAKYLEREIRALVKEKTPPRTEDGDDWNYTRQMKAPEDLCRTATVAHKLGEARPYIFRSYDNIPEDDSVPNPGPAHTSQIWQVGRATSAAPGFFKPVDIDGVDYVDGGFGLTNDPSLEIADEIYAYSESRVCVAEVAPISAFLTLGTGKQSAFQQKKEKFRLMANIKHTRSALVDVSETERRMRNGSRRKYHYVKLNGGEDLGKMRLDDFSDGDFKRMRLYVAAYMRRDDVQRELGELAQHLVNERRRRCEDRNSGRWERFALASKWKCIMSACNIHNEPGTWESSRRGIRIHITRQHDNIAEDSVDEELDKLGPRYPFGKGPFGHEYVDSY